MEKIFDPAAHGVGATKIRHTLDDEHIPIPAWLNYQKYGTFAQVFDGKPENKRHQWSTAMVKAILSSEVYIGNSVHNKQTAISFKNKKKFLRPKDDWYTVENTHEPIISKDVWDQAHAHIESRKRPKKAVKLKFSRDLSSAATAVNH